MNYNVMIPQLRDYLNSNIAMNRLPMIRGTWYHVDPYAGSNNSDGNDLENALASIYDGTNGAYERCISGRGDGIILYSGGTTMDNTTSYLKKELAWTKHGITVVGIAAPGGIFNRARIADVQVTTGTIATISMTGTTNVISDSAGGFLTAGFIAGQKIYIYSASDHTNDGVTTITSVTASSMVVAKELTTKSAATLGNTYIKSYNTQNITVSGNNNSFNNVMIWNDGALSYSLGGVVLTGARNYFNRCFIVGGAGCTATANERSLELGDGAQENIFEDCTIGTDTVDRGNNANCELYINGTTNGTARNRFNRCLFLSEAEGGTAHLAIKSAAATSMGRHMLFRDCDFECYVMNLGADQASVFGGTKFNTAKIGLMGQCSALGYATWDETEANNVVYLCGGAAAAEANGIGVAI